MTAVLSDIRVLDLSTEVSGSYCARMLGDFGADVIKVEPVEGNPERSLEPLKNGVSGFFAFLNSNKRAMSLNLDSVQGQALFRGLSRQADVVVESFPPGYLDDRRVGYDLLEAARPGIILTSITPFGQTGPWRQRPGNDLTAYALSGWAQLNGHKGKSPLKGSGYQASFVGAIAGLVGTIAALFHRDQTGAGQQVDVSVLEALTEVYGPRFLGFQHADAQAEARMNRDRQDFISGPVPCKDGYFALTLSRAHFWRDAMNELGLPELAKDDIFWNRVGMRDELAGKVEAAIAQRGKYELFDRISTMRAVCGMVLSTGELYENPHVREREFFVGMDQPGLGQVEMPGAPFKMSGTPFEYRRPAPRQSEHTREVLSELLGLEDADIDELGRAGDVA